MNDSLIKECGFTDAHIEKAVTELNEKMDKLLSAIAEIKELIVNDSEL